MPQDDTKNYKILPTPIISPSDPLLYRALELDNQMKILLISDPTAELVQGEENEVEEGSEGEESDYGSEEDQSGSEEGEETEEGADGQKDAGLRNAAAALSVKAGSFHEPKESPGLAHFLEHMVFMGSKKYPEENKFDGFVSSHNGYDNAYTDAENTCYYFEVQPSHFDQALDIWSRFYIDPIMSKDSVNREIQAVDSEFNNAQTSDSNRISGFLLHSAKQGHPAAKFGWGNLLSLKGKKFSEEELKNSDNEKIEKTNLENLYQNLIQLHKKYYSAKIMTLAVQSPHSLDELEDMVLEKFQQVPNTETFISPTLETESHRDQIDTWQSLYGNKFWEILPVGDRAKLILNFQLPNLESMWKSDPSGYIDWLVGHEGKGSIHNYLESRGLANAVEAGVGNYGETYNSLYGMFEIIITLTEKGAENVDEVTSCVFSYLDMLRKDGARKDIWDIF